MKQAKRIIALLLALVMVVGMAPAIAAVDGDVNDPNYPVFPNPGAIGLDKTAQAVSGQDNTWEITLTIDGKNYPTTSDVVLVIDRSNSMDDYGRMEDTKKAAKAFGAQLLQDGNTRIAIVTYERTATLVNGGQFYGQGDLEAFNQAIDSIRTNGGTNQQAGIHAAQELLDSAASTGTRKNIVILSDGEPTYSYPFTVTADYVGCTSSHEWSSSGPDGGALENYQFAANYNEVIGSGSDFELVDYIFLVSYSIRNASVTAQCEHGVTYTENGFAFLDENGQLIYSKSGPSNNGVATIWEANQSKAKGTTIFSVALQAGTNGESVLQSCATDPINGYFAIGQNDDIGTALQNAFTQIAGQMAIAASDGVVTDPMSEYVDLQIQGASVVTTGDLDTFTAGNADIYINQGTVTYDPETETITWNAGDIQENRQAVLKYRVTLDPDFGYPTVGTFPTNKETTFDYTNYLGNEATKNFPIPQVAVDRGTILVHWYQVDANGSPVNENGAPVETPAQAHQFADPVYFAVDGNTALNFTTYEVSHTYGGNNPDGYAYMGYLLNNANEIASTEATASVTITSTQTSQEVWFAYCPGFTVVHSSNGNRETFLVPAAGDTFDLTGVVYDGYLYGGYRHNDSNGDFGTESGLTLTPEAGDVYYLKEVDDAYLQPKILHVYNWYYGYKVTQVHMVTAIDDTNYQHVGFIVGGENSAEAVKSDDTVYEKIDVDYADGRHVEKNLDDFFSDLQGNGLLHMQRYSGEIAANGSFAFTPFFVTMDSVRVTGTETRTVSFGDGTFHNDGSTGGLSVSDAPNDFKPELYTSSAAANSLTLLSSYAVSWDEAPAATQYTVTKVDGGSTATQTVEPGDQTGQITYAGQSGKVFAGWFTDSACTLPADFSNVQGDVTVYAKYVDAPSTGVSVQSKRGGATTLKTTVTLDTDQFAQVGFAYDCNGDTGTAVAGEKTEKRSLMGWFFSQGNTTYQYSGSWSTSNLGFMDSFTITPYWVTLDGTTVYGEAESYLSLGALILRK